MDFQHYIITRFSINFDTMNNYNLFNSKRLDIRLNLFAKYCFPSVKNQNNQNFLWLILIDPLLPIKYKNILTYLIKDHPNFKLIIWNKNYDLGSTIWLNTNKRYIITTRLDDDDSIHPDMISTIQNVFENLNDKDKINFITFPSGLKNNNGILLKLVYPFNSVGLTFTTDKNILPYTIYKFNHRKIMNGKNYLFSKTNNKNFYNYNIGIKSLNPNILMWIYNIHNTNDSNGGYKAIYKHFEKPKIKSKFDIEINKNIPIILKKFGIL